MKKKLLLQQQPKKPIKLKLQNIILIFIGCLIISLIIWEVGIDTIFKLLLKINLNLLLLTVLFNSWALILNAVRWSNLLQPLSLKQAFDAGKAHIICQGVNQIAPPGSGELVKAYVCKKQLAIPIGKTLALSLVERLTDITFLLCISICGIIVLVSWWWQIYWFQMFIPLIIVIMGYVLVFNPKFIDKFSNQLRRLESLLRYNPFQKVIRYITNFIGSFKSALITFQTRKLALALTFLLTCSAWLAYCIAQLLILYAFDLEITLFQIVVITCISWLIGIFSFLPGGLGTRDFSFAILLTTFGFSFEVGATVALVSRIITFLICGIGTGISSTLSSTGERKQKQL